jgi:phosphoribosylpyrophosphate synthetase
MCLLRYVHPLLQRWVNGNERLEKRKWKETHANVCEQAIRRVHHGESISVLFDYS